MRAAAAAYAGLEQHSSGADPAAERQSVRRQRPAQRQGRSHAAAAVHDLRRHPRHPACDRRADQRPALLLQEAGRGGPRLRALFRAGAGAAAAVQRHLPRPAGRRHLRSGGLLRCRGQGGGRGPARRAPQSGGRGRLLRARRHQLDRCRCVDPVLHDRPRGLPRIRPHQADLHAVEPEEARRRADDQPAARGRHEPDGDDGRRPAAAAAGGDGADPRFLRGQDAGPGREGDPGRHRRADGGAAGPADAGGGLRHRSVCAGRRQDPGLRRSGGRDQCATGSDGHAFERAGARVHQAPEVVGARFRSQ